jgi:hypothetical protein
MDTVALSQPANFGTAQAAKWMAAVIAVTPVTVSPFMTTLEPIAVQRIASKTVRGSSVGSPSNVLTDSKGSSVEVPYFQQAERPTTASEEVVGELRSLALLNANWDAENAAAPDVQSVRAATSFVNLLPLGCELPEPMLLVSGRAGLYWDNDRLYADLEFFADGRVTYYVEHPGEAKHKGVVRFDGQSMPAVFSTIIVSRLA